jgi:hypothetical protein
MTSMPEFLKGSHIQSNVTSSTTSRTTTTTMGNQSAGDSSELTALERTILETKKQLSSNQGSGDVKEEDSDDSDEWET